jgi:mannose-6-phosphate isomerase
MVNAVRRYDWGSRSLLPRMRGESDSAGPEAEVWMGAHPDDSSQIVPVGGEPLALADVLADAGAALVGRDVASRHGRRLPYLLKLLAADAPLSVQLHPDAAQAAAGYAAEEAAGVARDDPARRYRDPYAKPELLAPLAPFAAMVGLRSPGEVRRLLGRVGPVTEPLALDADHPDGSLETVRRLLCLPRDSRRELVDAAAAAASRYADPAAAGDRATGDPWTWVHRLAERYPDDPAVVMPLVLEVITLEPGEAIFLPAGVLHAYLYGLGVEVMGASDNVLRAGLTSKHVDVDLVVSTARSATHHALRLRAVPAGDGWEGWPAPVDAFDLSRRRLGPAEETTRTSGGPEIVLCVEGSASVTGAGSTVRLTAGESAFIPATTSELALSGPGVVFRCAVPTAGR